ncbi:hypothetical protein CTI12_AA265010 [Artemisia annua]|uniref:Zinc knuckle CX2CX4HX4C n=1 Tax=Artemisia annua TaxID=35608 RepID=A0A2U1NHH5_ARTAN|nr:hypothetical protein CTI12_AA265010 [Artemisia annua]
MLDAFTSSMFIDSWGRISFAHALVELSVESVLKSEVSMAIPNDDDSAYTEIIKVEYEWTPPHCDVCKVFGHDHINCPKSVKEAVCSDINVASKASTTLVETDDGFTKVQNRKDKGKKVGVQMPQNKSFRGIDVGKGAKFTPSKPKQVYVAVSKKPNATKEKIAKEASRVWYQEPGSTRMVQTKSGYKASVEPFTVLQQHRRLPQAKETISTMTNTEDQPFSHEDLATKIDKLASQLESVMGWIQAQPSNQPKAHATPQMETYGFSGFDDEDEDDEDEREDFNKTMKHGSYHPFKVEDKIDIPTSDGTIDAEKLDSWLDQLETYFPLYGFCSNEKVVFARLKLTSHVLAWWNSQLKIMSNEDITWKKFTQLLQQEFYPMGIMGNTEDKCWKLHPELFPKKWIKNDRSGKRTTATALVNDVVELELVKEADKTSTTLVETDDGFTEVQNRKDKGKKVGVQMPQKKPFRGIDG